MGWPVIFGVTAGCFLGNAYFWLGPQDVILGSIANLVAATIIFLLRKRQMLGCIFGSISLGTIVGSYLWFFFGFQSPEIFGLQLPVWLAIIVNITISTLIVIAGIGYLILQTLINSSIKNQLESRGLNLYLEN